MMRRKQTRADSLLEAATNVVLGFVLALVVQALIYPLFGIRTSLASDGTIAVVFTAVSLVRSYMVRRAFETFGNVMDNVQQSPARDSPHARP
jgi:hypothetical protein